MKSITVQELHQAMKLKKPFVLIDVREDYEYNYGHLECLHIPMAQLAGRIQELQPEKETYIICKSGNRSEAVADFLQCNFGFQKISFVKGGVEAYAKEIDNSIQI